MGSQSGYSPAWGLEEGHAGRRLGRGTQPTLSFLFVQDPSPGNSASQGHPEVVPLGDPHSVGLTISTNLHVCPDRQIGKPVPHRRV